MDDTKPQELIRYYSNILGLDPSAFNTYPTMIIVYDYVNESKIFKLLKSIENSNRYSIIKSTNTTIMNKIYKSTLILNHTIEIDMDLSNSSGSVIRKS